MEKYSKLIKLPIKKPQKSDIKAFKAANRALGRYRQKEYIVTASVAEDVLTVDIFKCDKTAPKLAYRHFYDKQENKYVTQKVIDGKKGTGTIYTYCWDHYAVYADGAERTILDYLDIREGTTGLQAINQREQKRLEEKRQKRYDKIAAGIDERMAAVSEKPPQEFYNWLRDDEYLSERYFIYDRSPKAQTQSGICTFCKEKFSAPAKNGKTLVCPKCGSELQCRSVGRSGDALKTWGNVSYVERVRDTDGKPAVVERVFYTFWECRSIRSWNKNLSTELYVMEVERRFYDPENGYNYKSSANGEAFYYWDTFLGSGKARWCSNNQGTLPWRENIRVYPDNLDEITGSFEGSLKNVETSALAKSLREEFRHLARAEIEFPALENLVKQGLTHLAEQLVKISIHGNYAHCSNNEFMHRVNVETKSAASFLRVSRPELRELARENINMDEYNLYTAVKAAFGAADIKDVKQLAERYPNTTYALFDVVRYGCRPQKLISYIAKQAEIYPGNKGYILSDYRDYLKLAVEVYGGLNGELRYPKDFLKEHDKLIDLYERRKDAIIEEGLSRRAKLLEKLAFSDENYTIFPLRTSEDFVNESKLLSHCVKSYIEDCADGSTNIFGLRKADEPDTPYFTVNIDNDGKLIQNRGKRNCDPPCEVRDFTDKWLAFVKRKLKSTSLYPGVEIKSVEEFRKGA